jgi:phosphoribosyl-AMP cyclohydrolase
VDIFDLPDAVRLHVVERLRAFEPDAIGVLVHGSYARGEAQPQSDLDMAVLLDGPGRVHYRSWFEELSTGRLLYVSANTDLTIDRWRTKQSEPEEWSFGFPAAVHYRWVWSVEDQVRTLLGDPPVERHPGEVVEVGDMIETVSKAIRAATTGDDDGVRYWAHAVVRYAAPAVVAVNEPHEVREPREALMALLALPVAPPGWRRDVRVCLGLDPLRPHEVAATARRLVANTLGYVRGLDIPLANPGDRESLESGRFERWLAEM